MTQPGHFINNAATIDGVNVLVAYAGSMPDFTGLDQVNLEIPRSLIGRGEVDVRLTVDGHAANPVKINIGGPAAYFLFDSPPRTETFVIKFDAGQQRLRISKHGGRRRGTDGRINPGREARLRREPGI